MADDGDMQIVDRVEHILVLGIDNAYADADFFAPDHQVFIHEMTKTSIPGRSAQRKNCA